MMTLIKKPDAGLIFSKLMARIYLHVFPVLCFLLAIASVILVVFIGQYKQVDLWFLTRDLAAIAGLPLYAGLLSQAGILVWSAAATAALFASAVAAVRERSPRHVLFLLGIGILTMILGLDDLFMLHENFRGNEWSIFALYGLSAGVIIMLFRDVFLSTQIQYAIIAGVCFAFSLGIDAVQGTVQAYAGEYRILLEDGFKFLGAVAWFLYIWTAGITLSCAPNESSKNRREHD